MMKVRAAPFQTRLTPEEREKWQNKADKYAGGNMSQMLRLAVDAFEGESGRLEEIEERLAVLEGLVLDRPDA